MPQAKTLKVQFGPTYYHSSDRVEVTNPNDNGMIVVTIDAQGGMLITVHKGGNIRLETVR